MEITIEIVLLRASLVDVNGTCKNVAVEPGKPVVGQRDLSQFVESSKSASFNGCEVVSAEEDPSKVLLRVKRVLLYCFYPVPDQGQTAEGPRSVQRLTGNLAEHVFIQSKVL